jgi:hypothetical protein
MLRGLDTASGNWCSCGVFECLEIEISLNYRCTVSPYRAVNTVTVVKTNHLMLCREMFVVAFHAFAANWMRTAFCSVIQRIVVIPYRRFGTTIGNELL